MIILLTVLLVFTLGRADLNVSGGGYPQTATVSSIAAGLSSTQLLAANSQRRQAIIYNAAGANLYICFCTTADTAVNFTVIVPVGGFFEFPQPAYGGVVAGVWSALGGSGQVTEITP